VAIASYIHGEYKRMIVSPDGSLKAIFQIRVMEKMTHVHYRYIR